MHEKVIEAEIGGILITSCDKYKTEARLGAKWKWYLA